MEGNYYDENMLIEIYISLTTNALSIYIRSDDDDLSKKGKTVYQMFKHGRFMKMNYVKKNERIKAEELFQ